MFQHTDVQAQETPQAFPAGTTLTPSEGHYLVLMDPVEDTTAGGIVLAATAVQPAQTGTVVSVGLGRYHPQRVERMPTNYSGGDSVFIPSWVHKTTVLIGGEEYAIVDEKDIGGTVQRPAE